MENVEFVPFPKIARLSRETIITEKIDGTNASVFIGEDGTVRAGSRTRWITPESDNFGFASWVQTHIEELRTLGPGRHFGEWWGIGIQRGYGLFERRFSLFNVSRGDVPACCSLVPVLYQGSFRTETIDEELAKLHLYGSRAAPGFMKPEGVVVYHPQARTSFKKTIERDEEPKGRAAA